MKYFVSLEEALDILRSNISNMKTEKVPILNGIKRVVAENIYSKINNPPFNKSAMDGYAINVIDSVKEGSKFEVIGEVFAGQVFKNELKENEAIKIMTGSPIPQGANSVIKKEDITNKDRYIVLSKDMSEYENVCFKGEDIKENQILIEKGKELNYADIGILASAGIGEVKVYKKTKIAFLTTGDEVLDIDRELEEGKIYNSNKYSIIARLLEIGEDCEYIEHENDEYEKIGNRIKDLSEKVDLIITTGGASVGDKDLLNEAISYINGETLFWKVKIKPGSAVIASKYNGILIISLSGNPTAALTTFELLVRPVLDKLNGKNNVQLSKEKAILSDYFNKKSEQRRFLRGKIFFEEEKQYVSITQVKSGNGILSSALDSNCLIEIDEGNTALGPGEIVTIIKL